MYLALFLSPWVLIYAISTMAMNHRAFFQKLYDGQIVMFEKERELTYAGTFPESAPPAAIAVQILSSLGMDGAHGARRIADGRIVIHRAHPVAPRRITLAPATGHLLIEKEVFRAPAFLERMHRRRGFQHDYALEDTWGVSVDTFIVAMIFWVLSGLWMWWEMRATWRLGILFAAGGIALFAFYLTTL